MQASKQCLTTSQTRSIVHPASSQGSSNINSPTIKPSVQVPLRNSISVPSKPALPQTSSKRALSITQAAMTSTEENCYKGMTMNQFLTQTGEKFLANCIGCFLFTTLPIEICRRQFLCVQLTILAHISHDVGTYAPTHACTQAPFFVHFPPASMLAYLTRYVEEGPGCKPTQLPQPF